MKRRKFWVGTAVLAVVVGTASLATAVGASTRGSAGPKAISGTISFMADTTSKSGYDVLVGQLPARLPERQGQRHLRLVGPAAGPARNAVPVRERT